MVYFWLRRESVCLQCRRPGFDPWVGKIPWRRKWQPTPVLLPGKSHGQRSLVSPTVHGVAKSRTRLNDFTFIFFIFNFIYLFGLFSGCGILGLLLSWSMWASHCSGFSFCGVRVLGLAGFSSCGSRALEHRLNTGLVAPRHVEYSQIRDLTHVSCIGRRILYH